MRHRIVALALVMATGCTAKKLAVNNADFALERQIEKRLPLYSAQKKRLSEDVDRFLNEQKPMVRDALPLISALELHVNKVEDQYFYLKGLYDTLARNFSRLMARNLSVLDEKQQKDFFAILTSENERLRKRPARETMEKVQDRFETLFGKATEAQRTLLTEYEPNFRQRHADRLVRREALQTRFREIFAMDLSAEGKERYFVDAFDTYQGQAVDSSANVDFVKKLIPTLSDKQQEVFEGRVKELREILTYFLEADY